jgi:hypothetical protein
VPQQRKASELEKRLSSEVFSSAKNSKKFETLSELSRRFVKESEERIKKNQIRREKSILWVARILFVPTLAITVAYFFILIGSAIFLGEIASISRYSEKPISLQSDPAMFWITLSYHSAITAFLCWGTFQLGGATKWFALRNPNAKIDRTSLSSRR